MLSKWFFLLSLFSVMAYSCSIEEEESIPNFSSYTNVIEKKVAFFNYLYPLVINENRRIKKERTFLELMLEKINNNKKISNNDKARLLELSKRYRHPSSGDNVTKEWFESLLIKVDFIPAPLVLSQAANESAWGTSRFARQGRNFFGQWCYSKGCGMVPIQREDNATHEVAKFDSASDSVHAYFMNMNRNNAYKELREIRHQLRLSKSTLTEQQQAVKLAEGLIRYSERKEAYVEEVQDMIEHNHNYWK